VNGLGAIAATVSEIARGAAPARAERRIAHLASLVRGRGACAHPDGAAEFVLSAAETFAAQFADHAREGSCQACLEEPEMPLPGAPAAQGRGSGCSYR
jgi:NADH:ubiquinone oxidoreductase subunit F (NADH-binding)